MNLPTWKKVSDKISAGFAITLIEQFIYDYEPAGEVESKQWRSDLKAILDVNNINHLKRRQYGIR